MLEPKISVETNQRKGSAIYKSLHKGLITQMLS